MPLPGENIAACIDLLDYIAHAIEHDLGDEEEDLAKKFDKAIEILEEEEM